MFMWIVYAFFVVSAIDATGIAYGMGWDGIGLFMISPLSRDFPIYIIPTSFKTFMIISLFSFFHKGAE